MAAPEEIELGTLIYWAFQTALLGLVAVACWILREIRAEIRHGQRVNNWLRSITLAMHTRCAMMHPDKPMPPIPEDPESRD